MMKKTGKNEEIENEVVLKIDLFSDDNGTRFEVKGDLGFLINLMHIGCLLSEKLKDVVVHTAMELTIDPTDEMREIVESIKAEQKIKTIKEEQKNRKDEK